MDVQTLVARMMAPMARRVRLMVARAVVTSIADAGKIQSAQVKLLDGEVRDGIEILHQYGVTSIPPGKPEGLYFSVGGDRDHGVLICVADRQFRLKDIAPGEAALYDDLGQKVHLTRDGIVIDGAGKPITLTNTPKVRMEADLDVTGEIKDRCDTGGKTMAGMRATYNGHTHNETNSVTNTPNQGM
jgi:phage baseplate assembly protein V